MKKTIGVMMSTYNGSKWLCEQLDSLINQDNVRIHLFVRDDGSSDNTLEIIYSYKDKFENLNVYEASNLGATLSFYSLADLVQQNTIQCDYYAFCDQDDIWEADKLITALRWLERQDNNKPNLYYSNLMMVMQDGKTRIGKLINYKAISTNRFNGLASIGTYGCTCVFNRTALDYFCELHDVRKFIFHDNWIYAVCAFCGNIFYDDTPHILYRQTGSNASGVKKTGISLWIQRLSQAFNLNNDKRIYENIALELMADFSKQIPDKDKKYLAKICDYRYNPTHFINLIFTRRMKTKSFSKNICIVGRTILRAL